MKVRLSFNPAARRMVAALKSIAIAAAAFGAFAPSAGCAQEAPAAMGQVVPSSLLQRLHTVSMQGLAHTPAFSGPNPLMAVKDDQPASADGSLVLYIGAEYCPYCAAMRWPLAIALMRFGELSGVRYSRSSSNDVFPDTATLSFHGATFEGTLLKFESVELSDHDGTALEKPTLAQRQVFTRLNDRGSIPFLELGEKYVSVGSPFSPQSLASLDWKGVVQKLEQGSNATSQDIMSEANLLTAAMCTLTKQQPKDVCTAPGIEAVAKLLPQ